MFSKKKKSYLFVIHFKPAFMTEVKKGISAQHHDVFLQRNTQNEVQSSRKDQEMKYLSLKGKNIFVT